MPRLEMFDSNTQFAQSQGGGVIPSTGGRQVSEIAGVVKKMEQELGEMRTARQVSEANYLFETGLTAVQQEMAADNDPDSLSSGSYQKRMKEIKDKSLEHVSDPITKFKYSQQLDEQVNIVNSKLAARNVELEMTARQGAMTAYADANQAAVYQSKSKDEVQGLFSKYKLNLDNDFGTAKPVQSPAAYQSNLDAMTSKYKDWLEYRSSSDPVMVATEIDAGDHDSFEVDGKVYYLDKKELADLSTKSMATAEKIKEKFEKEQEKALQEKYNKNATEALINIIDKKESLTDLQTRLKGDNIKDDDYIKLEKYLLSDQEVNKLDNFNSTVELNKLRDGNATDDEVKNKVVELVTSHKMEAADGKAYINAIDSDRTLKDKAVLKNGTLAIRAYGQKNISNEVTFDSETGGMKGQIDQLEYEYNKRVQEEEASGNRIYEIADEIIAEHMAEATKTTITKEDVKNKNLKLVKQYKVFYLQDRQQYQAVINNKLVDITPEEAKRIASYGR